MKLNPVRLGAAGAVAFGILWVICSALVAFLPDPMMSISGHMVHADLTGVTWTLSWSGFFLGLLAWAIVAGLTAWLIALLYGFLGSDPP